ncbi:hypothetical protein TNCV_763291 [Trichonephila clavipes]|nr:hypothetical protein TNCV_763291 [Trichonephila clavipes]
MFLPQYSFRRNGGEEKGERGDGKRKVRRRKKKRKETEKEKEGDGKREGERGARLVWRKGLSPEIGVERR